jgi:hypothetical protein
MATRAEWEVRMGTWTERKVRALGVCTDLLTAASIFGIGRTAAYELARSDKFPTPVLRRGVQYVVPVKPILQALGLDGR